MFVSQRICVKMQYNVAINEQLKHQIRCINEAEFIILQQVIKKSESSSE